MSSSHDDSSDAPVKSPSSRRLSRVMSSSLRKLTTKNLMISTIKSKGEQVTVEDLRQSQGSVEEKGDFGMNPLMVAVGANCSNEVIEFLIAEGSDVNQKNIVGQTALFLAAANSKRLVEVLLDAGAEVNVIDQLTGRTPLMEAAGYAEDMTVVNLLVMKGAYLDVIDSFNRTASDFASDRDRLGEYINNTSLPDGYEVPMSPPKSMAKTFTFEKSGGKSPPSSSSGPASPREGDATPSPSLQKAGSLRQSFKKRMSFSTKSSQAILQQMMGGGKGGSPSQTQGKHPEGAEDVYVVSSSGLSENSSESKTDM